MKNILILGGTGAMGVYLVDILAKTGRYNIVITSRNAHQSSGTLSYVQGNARDNAFLYPLLEKRFDAIVDFMNYDLDEFALRCNQLLTSTSHYIWFSSCRVYANSKTPLDEKSARLLETTTDQCFLATNRYALRKARQEDIIKKSGFSNYTIIRPYITYGVERLQLGIYEKEQWLFRILQGKDLVINSGILDKTTTLTYGNDVSTAISKIILNEKAMGKVIQIASDKTMKWSEILELYLSVIKTECGISPQIYTSDSMQAIDELYEGGYNTIYDRVYNRSFKSRLIEDVIGEKIEYTDMKSGLISCLTNFLKSDKHFLKIDWIYEAYQDILTNQYYDANVFATKEDMSLYNEYRNKPLSDIKGLKKDLYIYKSC